MMEIVKDIRKNDTLRAHFNTLAEKTFGLNFENWYQAGYWNDHYIPYCMVEDGEVIANVSVNRTDMLVNGCRKKLIQLGTVMTAEEHRNRGLIRMIMTEVDKDFADTDGVYLFANDEVVDFYPKFGFTKGTEYVCSKTVEQSGACEMKSVLMDTAEKRGMLLKAMKESTFKTGCSMVDNEDLIFFYIYQFMQDCVYYSEMLNAWVIAEMDEGTLVIHNVFTGCAVRLEDVIAAFGADVKKVILGFTPANITDWDMEELHEEDTTFFVRGGAVKLFGENKLRVPSLSHA